MKYGIWLGILILITAPVWASTKITLEDTIPPQFITVDKDHLYLTSGVNISVFSLKDLKIIKQFGKKGEGPGEFLIVGDDRGMTLDARSENLIVISRRKISYFSKKGEFINEIRVKHGFSHIPVGENFVGTRNKQIDKIVYRTVNLYDKDFNVLATIHKKEFWFQQGKRINPVTVRPPFYCSYQGLVFCENGKGNVMVFNKNGEKIATTDLNISLVKVSEKDKAAYHYYYKTHPVYKNGYEQLKNLIKFPEFYPKIKYFDVSEGKIYVLSHVKKGGKSEVFICDLKGKLIKKAHIDMPELDPQSVFPMIKVRNNKIYQIIENEDDEEAIDLFITDIAY